MKTQQYLEKAIIDLINSNGFDADGLSRTAKTLAAQFAQPAQPEDINGFSTDTKLIRESLRDSFYKETGEFSYLRPREFSDWLENKIVQYMQIPHPAPAPGKQKPFIVANVKEIVEKEFNETDIVSSRMVEMLNEVAERYYGQPAQEGYRQVASDAWDAAERKCKEQMLGYYPTKIKYLSSLPTPSAQVSEAVEFAEWVGKSYDFDGNGEFIEKNWIAYPERFTTPELYTLFLNRDK